MNYLGRNNRLQRAPKEMQTCIKQKNAYPKKYRDCSLKDREIRPHERTPGAREALRFVSAGALEALVRPV